MHPNPITHVPIDDHRPAVDHAHREPVTYLSLVRDEQLDVEHQCLASFSGLAADANPLVFTALLHGGIEIEAQRSAYRFYQPESLVESSTSHRVLFSKRDAERPLRGIETVPDVFSAKTTRADDASGYRWSLLWPWSADFSSCSQPFQIEVTCSRSSRRVSLCSSAPTGSSMTANARQDAAIRQGGNAERTLSTRPSRETNATSIAKRMEKV